jgi:hypothetical protein
MLHAAALGGVNARLTELVRERDTSGALVHDVNGMGDWGATPLWCAASEGHTDAVARLHELGADINTPDEVRRARTCVPSLSTR